MKTLPLLLLVAISLLTASGMTAQTWEDAPMVLEQAAHAEMVEGDLARAARLYRQVATSASASRNHVARALVALGKTYELQGSPAAVPAYQRVVSEFADQPEMFLVARAQLKALSAKASSGAGEESTGAEYELILQAIKPSATQNSRIYDFSPDGSKLITIDRATSERRKRFPNLRNEIYLRDNSGSVSRPLIDDAEDWEAMGYPRWSPNGKYILYSQGKHNKWRWMLLDLHSKRTKQFPSDVFQVVNGVRGVEWMPDSAGLMLQSEDGFRIIGRDGKVKKHFAVALEYRTLMATLLPRRPS